MEMGRKMMQHQPPVKVVLAAAQAGEDPQPCQSAVVHASKINMDLPEPSAVPARAAVRNGMEGSSMSPASISRRELAARVIRRIPSSTMPQLPAGNCGGTLPSREGERSLIPMTRPRHKEKGW
jgi:hypothetical protein